MIHKNALTPTINRSDFYVMALSGALLYNDFGAGLGKEVQRMMHLLPRFFFISGDFLLICLTRSSKIVVTFIFIFADVSKNVLKRKKYSPSLEKNQ